MNAPVQIPTKGHPATAAWGASVAKTVNGLGAMAPAGMLFRDGVTGMGFASLPQNLRDRRRPLQDLGRFVIALVRDGDAPDEPPVKKLTNCYFDVGGKTYRMEDQPVPTVSEDEPEVFVALQVNAAGTSVGGTVAKYDTFEEMQEAQSDRKYYITPLYRLDADGNVLVDFRIGPAASQGEF